MNPKFWSRLDSAITLLAVINYLSFLVIFCFFVVMYVIYPNKEVLHELAKMYIFYSVLFWGFAFTIGPIAKDQVDKSHKTNKKNK